MDGRNPIDPQNPVLQAAHAQLNVIENMLPMLDRVPPRIGNRALRNARRFLPALRMGRNDPPVLGRGAQQVRRNNANNNHPRTKITDNCHICCDPLNKLCIKCRDDKEETGEHENCILAWGKCKHAFHFHCFALWYDGNENCPICDTKWVFKPNVARDQFNGMVPPMIGGARVEMILDANGEIYPHYF